MSRFDLHCEQLAPGTTFLDRYTHICEREGLSLFRPVLAKLSKCCLEVNLDMISKNDLIALLHALVNDDTLTSARFESRLLKDNPHLTSDLRKLRLHSHGRRLPVYVDSEVMSSLCNALHRHISRNELNLKVLRLIGLPVLEGELAEICSALQTSKSLHLLSLEGVPLSGKHLDVLLPVLPRVQALTILNLGQCRIGRAEALQISRYLQDDRKLQRLILNGNPIGDSGVEYLVKVLRHHTTFRALDLQNCGLSSVGCFALQSLLRNNLNIELCDIRRNTAVSRHSALTIAEILLENNKFRPSGNTYKPLDLDMSPPIDASQIAIEDSGLDGVRHNPPSREVPSVKLPPKDLQLRVQDGNHKKEFVVADTPAKQGIFISSELLSKFETSLVKFQVLLDYLESEHLECGLGPLGGGVSHSVSRASTQQQQQQLQQQQQHDYQVQKRAATVVNESSTFSPEGSRVSRTNEVHNNPSPKADPTASNDKEPSSNEKQSSSRKSYSDSFTNSRSLSTRSTKRNATPSTGGTQPAHTNMQQPVSGSVSTSSGTTATATTTSTGTRSGSTVKKSSSKVTDPKGRQQQQRADEGEVEEKENDRTITSDHEFDNDSFEFNFTDVGGITKESSYMKIAGEIFGDPKEILESTRTSLAASRSSSNPDGSHSPGASTKTTTNTNTNVDELQERLRNIQSKYNVASGPIRTLAGSAMNEAGENGKRKVRVDDVNISESWPMDPLEKAGGDKGSFELSDVSLGSSFSGDLTGSDLDKF